MHPEFQPKQSEHFAARVIVEVFAISIGMALLVFAFAADHRWLDRHFLPAYFVTRRVYVAALSLARVTTAVLGVSLALVLRPRVGRYVSRVPLRTLLTDVLRVLLPIALALGTSELVLRHTFRHTEMEEPETEEPHRRPDSRLGWVFVPSRTGHDKIDGRTIEYAFDSSGYRVRHADQPVDPERLTVVFAGESIMVGQGLTWEETIPAQVERILGIQSANLAVHGFSTDQAYLRLLAELPRFRQPVAVVTLFAPSLFDRNMDQDRPHLGPDLVWHSPKPRWRLALITCIVVPYRSDGEIERGVALTRAVLRATVALAHARGAVPLIVVPQFLPEDPTERALRIRILDEAGLPYVWVGLDPSWRLPTDLHPNPRAARAIAVAVAGRLRDATANASGKQLASNRVSMGRGRRSVKHTGANDARSEVRMVGLK